ncbi:MAG: hypothetical protein GY844_17410 [Bradyrhizobium sp.]|nr:hypothetical protein [Bradyrhizobium sp.]
MEPNWFATIALLAWPLVALWLYRVRPIGEATIWTILGGYLLLPAGWGIKLPMIPPIDKASIPCVSAFIICLLMRGRNTLAAWRHFGLIEAAALVYVCSPIVTALLNGDDIRGRGAVLPGVGLYDGLSTVEYQLLQILPLVLARQFLRSPRDTELLLRAFVIAGLVYSLPMLLEIRLSPQLHNWIYGYFPHSFLQQIRAGGFRPVVFLGHGLLIAFMAMISIVASASLWRSRTRIVRMLPPVVVTIYLSGVLILCKSVGAVVYTAFLLPLVRFASARLQLRVAAMLAIAALLYPTLRAADLVPTESLLSLSASFSDERAESLATRFYNEKLLLDHASERFWFGWGRFGRNRIIDLETGKEESISDGLWILTMGQLGYVGFLAQFGLWALIVFRAVGAARRIADPISRNRLAALALILAVYIVDQLPNAPVSPLMWLIAGALLGRAEDAARARPRFRRSSPPAPDPLAAPRPNDTPSKAAFVAVS